MVSGCSMNEHSVDGFIYLCYLMVVHVVSMDYTS